MPARKCRGNSSYRHLAPVHLSLMSRRHSTALPSPSRYGKRYEVEGRTNFSELRLAELRRIHLPRNRVNKGLDRRSVPLAASQPTAGSYQPLLPHPVAGLPALHQNLTSMLTFGATADCAPKVG